jgi:hypothetical protein
MSGAVSKILPIAGAAAGFMMGGGPAGAMAGYQLGSAAGGLFGGQQQAAPGQAQQVGGGAVQAPGGMLLSGVPGMEKGAMALPQGSAAPGGGADKAKALQSALMTIGPMVEGSNALQDRDLARKKIEADMQNEAIQAQMRRLVMPSAQASNMGSYGPNTGMAYLGGR